MFANVAQRTAVVAFRGTEQTKWKDVLTDLSLVPASFDPEGINLAESPLARGISMLRGGLLRQSGLRAVLAEGPAVSRPRPRAAGGHALEGPEGGINATFHAARRSSGQCVPLLIVPGIVALLP